jgi:ankyrin repeat protein
VEEDTFDQTNQLPDDIHRTAGPSVGHEGQGAADINHAGVNHVQEPSPRNISETPPNEEAERHIPDPGIIDDEEHSAAGRDTTIPEPDENAPESRNDEDLEPNVRLKAVQSQVIQNQFLAAKFELDAHQYAEAEALLRQVVRHSQEMHGESYEWKDETEDMLASACFGQNKFTETEGILRKSLADRRRDNKPEKALDAIHFLAEVYFAKDDLDRAVNRAQNAVHGKIELLGNDHPSVHRSVALLVKIFEAKNDAPGIKGFERFLPKDYLHPQRQELEKLGNMKPEEAAARVGVDILKDLLPPQSYEKWGQIRENIKHRTKGISGWGKGYTLLHAITEYGNEEAIRFLVEKEPAVDAKDCKGRTPLYLAAGISETVVRYFIEAKADVDSPAKNRKTPLMVAAEKSKPKIVKLLVDNHAEVNAMDELHWTALHYAAMFGSEEVTKLLLQSDAEIGREGANKRTPLHCAASRGHLAVVRVLVANGAKTNVKSADSPKATPLDMAKKHHHENVVLFLKNNPSISSVVRPRLRSRTSSVSTRSTQFVPS